MVVLMPAPPLSREKHRDFADQFQAVGLCAQEIALLQIKEVAQLSLSGGDFKLHEVMSLTLTAANTKGVDAMNRSKSQYQRNSI